MAKIQRMKTNRICYLVFIEFKSISQRFTMIQNIRLKVKDTAQYAQLLLKIQNVMYVDSSKLKVVQKTENTDNNEEDGDDDKNEDNDDDDDDTDGDNDIRAMKESDVQNQISQFLINIRTTIKVYITKTVDERLTMFSESLNERVQKIKEYLVIRLKWYKSILTSTKTICTKITASQGTFIQIRDQRESQLKELLVRLNLLLSKMESDGYEFKDLATLKIDLTNYLNKEKFFSSETVTKEQILVVTMWINTFYERVNTVYDNYFSVVESKVEGLTKYVTDQNIYIIT